MGRKRFAYLQWEITQNIQWSLTQKHRRNKHKDTQAVTSKSATPSAPALYSQGCGMLGCPLAGMVFCTKHTHPEVRSSLQRTSTPHLMAAAKTRADQTKNLFPELLLAQSKVNLGATSSTVLPTPHPGGKEGWDRNKHHICVIEPTHIPQSR